MIFTNTNFISLSSKKEVKEKMNDVKLLKQNSQGYNVVEINDNKTKNKNKISNVKDMVIIMLIEKLAEVLSINSDKNVSYFRKMLIERLRNTLKDNPEFNVNALSEIITQLIPRRVKKYLGALPSLKRYLV